MAARKTVLIQPLGFEAPVARAARELEHYLPKLSNVAARALSPRPALPRVAQPTIVLATSDHLSGLGLGLLPASHPLDDAIALIPKKDTLYLIGSNGRSVLFAAYRLLEQLGAVFLRPGPGGEVLPRRPTLALPRRPIREKASYRHRGICIEGSPRIEHVLDLLDWMAKKKMNSFQLQFRHAGVFWRRGYSGAELDPGTRKKPLCDSDCLALDDRVILRMRELGMILHRVGHGWTSYAAGYEGLNWETTTEKGRDEWLAQVGGKRALWGGVAVNTELCYSNRDAREALINEVVTYARQHSEVDILHVWMSDSYNNKCECAECQKRTPSDWYAILIEEMARRIQADKLRTRIVFLGYVDLLWPPAEARITMGNVVFMYAPITRCFRHALTDRKCDEELSRARPGLNTCHLPRTNRMYAEIAETWKRLNLPDSFLFDYHQMWAVWQDGMGFDLGAVMARDMQDLQALGMGGFVSCQCTRAFYPLPYMSNAMADMLWNRGQSVRSHRRKIMSAAFGKYAEEVEAYFAQIVHLFKSGAEYAHGSALGDGSPRGRRRLSHIVSFAAKARRRFAGLARSPNDAVVRRSLQLLAIHAEHAELVAQARLAGFCRDKQAITAMRAQYQRRLTVILRDFSPWIDPLIARPVTEALAAAQKAAC